MTRFSRIQVAALIAAFFLIADQFIKQLVYVHKPLLDWIIVHIVFVQNTGASFGILQNNNPLFIWISLMVLGAALYFHEKIPSKAAPYAIIIAGGIMSNMLDRIIRGFVVDYIDLGWFPIFNIADSMIVIGTGILILISWRNKDHS